VDRIEDEIGSDRLAPRQGAETESLDALIANIRDRGLRTPLRVRPRDPGWRPDPDHPRNTGDQLFVLQSGRRRLAACRELGIDPVAFLSFVAPDAQRLDDLQERFFENATRKNLSTVEKLYSIGLIARETPGITQAQIADFIGTSVAQVSRGLAVVTHFGRLKAELDLNGVTRDEIDAALKRIRDEDAPTQEAQRKRAERARNTPRLPFKTRSLSNGQARLRMDKTGMRILTLRGAMLDDERIARIIDVLDETS
jgi:ParB/RepB/Spo0J family partition protein